jgi:hypothetical protein
VAGERNQPSRRQPEPLEFGCVGWRVIWSLAAGFHPFEGGVGFLEGVGVIALLFGLWIYTDRRGNRRDADDSSPDQPDERE